MRREPEMKTPPLTTVWVCLACGKRSHDQYGRLPIDRGWDESCILNAKEAYADKLEMANGRVVAISEGGLVPTTEASQK